MNSWLFLVLPAIVAAFVLWQLRGDGLTGHDLKKKVKDARPTINDRPDAPVVTPEIETNAIVGTDVRSARNLRILGGAILLFNLWLIGAYEITGIPVLLMTFGFAALWEVVAVRRRRN